MLNSPGVIFDLSICPCSSSFIVCSFSFIGSWSTSTHGDLSCLVLLSTMKHFLFLSCIKYCFTFSIFRNYGYESNFLLVHICLNVLCFYPFLPFSVFVIKDSVWLYFLNPIGRYPIGEFNMFTFTAIDFHIFSFLSFFFGGSLFLVSFRQIKFFFCWF